MPDMLVRLTDLPSALEIVAGRSGEHVLIRRAMTYEQGSIVDWIGKTFSATWADECKPAFGSHPVGCFIAAAGERLAGFCCIDCTLRGFAGPVGVAPRWQGMGIGRALLVAALHAMKAMGYGYSVIGNVAAPEFFAKAVGAVPIVSGKAEVYPKTIS